MVNVFGDVFYIENIALPCEEAVELVVENSQLQPIFTTVFNESGRRALLVNGVPITVDVTIEPRDFAMDVAVSTCVLCVRACSHLIIRAPLVTNSIQAIRISEYSDK